VFYVNNIQRYLVVDPLHTLVVQFLYIA